MFCRRRRGRLIFFTWSLPEPYGGTKILHTPPSMEAGQGRGGPAYPPVVSSFRVFFSPFRSRPGFKDASSCLPYYGGRGRRKEKAGTVKKAGFGHAGLSGPVQGFCLYGPCFLGEAGREPCLQERVWRPLSRTTRPCPPSAPGDPSRQQAARHTKRAPEDRGPCRLDLSGPQAWDVPVRAASRKGDQPAGRPARRAPGSCRCCDRW